MLDRLRFSERSTLAALYENSLALNFIFVLVLMIFGTESRARLSQISNRYTDYASSSVSKVEQHRVVLILPYRAKSLFFQLLNIVKPAHTFRLAYHSQLFGQQILNKKRRQNGSSFFEKGIFGTSSNLLACWLIRL